MEEIGEEMEASEAQSKAVGLEILTLLHKLFTLTDLNARIQANHFPKLGEKMGDKGVWDYFVKPKPDLKKEKELAEAQMRQFGDMFARK